ncbi:unnamed protein product [Rotaria sordida]|uniref:Reverse transcriptase domain-containing protein n=1 Tax=Rotaria sordida TaxID=392033 RepID=A0A815QX38_9BILA|nr:unnamed protein product [Rotaria sordida]
MSNTINQDAIIELLNQREILLFIRDLTQLVNKFNYSKLQHEQWSYYNNLGMTEGIWTGRVSKKMTKANSMCYTYGRSKNLIKQRLAKYKLQCDKNQEAINQCMKQAPLIIDMQTITTMINDLINKDQYELRLELERRKTMLRLDAEEHKIVEEFCKFKRRQTEVTKIMWKAINEQNNISDAIVICKKWLEVHAQASSYTLEDVQLPKINHIFISLFFQGQTSSAEHITEQTIAKSEQMEGIPVQPIMVYNDGLTIGISRYLGRLLGLLFNDATYCKKFHKAYNVIHAMEFYQKSDQLRLTTLFASFNINDLCLNFSHQQVTDALEHFLHSYISSDHSIQGIKIATILQLNFYRQTTGSASGSSLTIPLVYIYLFYWQPDLLEDLINKNELFFRYRDEAFITWNRSEDELRTLLAMANA